LDEVLNLFPVGLSQRLCSAEIDGIGLDELRIELVLADDLAETVADLRATAVPIAVRVLWQNLLSRTRNCSDFLDRTDADAVRLAEGTIDGTSLGYAHLCPAHERRNIGGIRITVANEPATTSRFVNSSPEDVATS